MIVVVTMRCDYFMTEQSERMNTGTQSVIIVVITIELSKLSVWSSYPVQLLTTNKQSSGRI